MGGRRSLASTLRQRQQSSARDTMVTSTSVKEPLRVNFENVVKQGMLKRRGYLFGLYLSKYMFYLEKGEKDGEDEMSEDDVYQNHKPYGTPPLLKYGKKTEAIYGCINLG